MLIEPVQVVLPEAQYATSCRCCAPEGLVNQTQISLTPERSSVVVKVTVTDAVEPEVVSIAVGEKLNDVRLGAEVSWAAKGI